MTDNKRRSAMEFVKDGWANLMTGLGFSATDKTRNTRFAGGMVLNEQEMLDLYRYEGFARRIINLPVREMTRKGFEIQGDTDGDLLRYYEDVGGKKMERNILRWSKVYGGAVAVFRINDGGKWEDELKENNIQDVENVSVYERYRVNKTTWVNNDPDSARYGEVEFYNISPLLGTPFKVHYTRVVEMDGLELPLLARKQNEGWGDSVFQNVYDRVRAMGSIYQITENIMEDFVTGVLSIEGLQDMIANGQEEFVKRRLALLDMSKHVINTMLIDSKEQYEKKTSSIAGLSDVLDRFANALSAVTGIPITLLMGQSTKGLGAKDDGSIRFWYDNIGSEQKEVLQPVIERLVYLCMLAKNSPTKGKEIDNWAIKFKPLWEMDDKEDAEVKKNQAESDEIYIKYGVLDPVEVAIARFGGDTYSRETKLIAVRPKTLEYKDPKDEPEPDSDDKDLDDGDGDTGAQG